MKPSNIISSKNDNEVNGVPDTDSTTLRLCNHCDTLVHRYYSVMVHKNSGRLLWLVVFLPICIVTDTLRVIIKHHGYKANKCDHLGMGSYAVTCVISE